MILVRTGMCGLVEGVAGVRLEMDDYSCDPPEIRWQEKKVYGAFVAFFIHLELVSVLLRLNEEVICLGMT